MTAIEFYDRTPIENIISSVSIKPDKIVFIGDGKNINSFGSINREFLDGRHIKCKLEFKSVNRNKINDIVRVLTDIVEHEDECVFDITGGDDLILVAMGMVFAKYQDNGKVRMRRFNISSGSVIDCDNFGKIDYIGRPNISVDELIAIHGGKVRYSVDDDDRTYRWNLTQDFFDDIKELWLICKDNPGKWNKNVTALSVLNTKKTYDKINLRLSACLSDFSEYADLFASIDVGFFNQLENIGVISDFYLDSNTLSVKFKSAQMHRCLSAAGTVFELKVMLLALSLRDKDGHPYFTDVLNGVSIDWDGEFHLKNDAEKDTENEIDLILMRGMVPVFVSCKNGAIKESEPYKLAAVAERFGNKFAKKVLIRTYSSAKDSCDPKYFRQRLEDMNIGLIEGAHRMDDEELANAIIDIV